MNIHLRTQDVALPPRGGDAIRRRVERMFSGLASRISHLHVTLKDVNGPRGGRDKVCILRAELADGGEVLVRGRSDHMRRALEVCARRFKDSVYRQIERRESRRRQRVRFPESSLA